jgi:hypothetical protein
LSPDADSIPDHEAAPFFIVGAPRCGTTSLSKYLAGNPQICFARPKEPHFFALYQGPLSERDLERKYLKRYFPDLASHHKAVGEGSTSYFYSTEIIARIIEHFPDARFVVMLRNPVDMIYSYHARMIYTRDEDQRDFATAWSLQSERAAGRSVPRTCRDARVLLYGEVGRLATYLEQLWSVAGRERVLTVIFDDFAADPGAVYSEVLEFLGVDHDGQTAFKTRNKHRDFKHGWMQSLYFGKALVPLTPLIRLYQGNLETVKTLTRPIRKRIRRFNTVKVDRQPLDPQMRATLSTEFRPEVERLSSVLDRDLSHWR